MSIENTIRHACKQVAVYWGNPVNDGYGNFTFDGAVEILCRWEDRKDIFITSTGDELTSKSVIYPLQDLDENGYLYLGTLDSLYDSAESSGGAIDNPKDIDGAYPIRRFDKVPVLGSTTQFLRKAYLTSKNMW
jgi:hypothetical protein